MAFRTLHALLAATIWIAIPAAALAQNNPLSPEKGLWNAPDYDANYNATRIAEDTARELSGRYKLAVAALEAKDFATAEAILFDLSRRDFTKSDTDFLMGLAKTGLNKWDEARTYLEVAVEKEPTRPEPKTRLGLTYVHLGALDAARKQRQLLAGLNTDCNKTCPDAKWIGEGLVVLDEALSTRVADPNAVDTSLEAALEAADAQSDGMPGMPKEIDPTKYSLVAFEDQHDLYDLLTKDGRCPVKQLAEPRQPCALVLYTPIGEAGKGRAANFKPVFGVISPKAVWAIHDKKLQKVEIEDLYFDNDDVIGRKGATYRSAAVIGNAENRLNCESGMPCLNALVAQDMFRMFGNMPDSVVAVIWGNGMKDVGTTRIR